MEETGKNELKVTDKHDMKLYQVVTGFMAIKLSSTNFVLVLNKMINQIVIYPISTLFPLYDYRVQVQKSDQVERTDI